MQATFCSYCGNKLGELDVCSHCGKANEFVGIPAPFKARPTGATTAKRMAADASPRPPPRPPAGAPAVNPTPVGVPAGGASADGDDRTLPHDRKAGDPVIGVLLCIEGDPAQLSQELREREYTVGRSGADIVIDSKKVSKLHARIAVGRSGVGRYTVSVSDLGSMNQTLINDLELEPNRSYTLADNDTITFATVRFRLRLSDVVRQTSAPPNPGRG